MRRPTATNAPSPMCWEFPWIKIKGCSVMATEPISNILAAVRSVYQELAKRSVQRNCIARTECCQFQLTGLTPHLTKGEALLAAMAFRSTGRRELPVTDDGVCPMLKRATRSEERRVGKESRSRWSPY